MYPTSNPITTSRSLGVGAIIAILRTPETKGTNLEA